MMRSYAGLNTIRDLHHLFPHKKRHSNRPGPKSQSHVAMFHFLLSKIMLGSDPVFFSRPRGSALKGGVFFIGEIVPGHIMVIVWADGDMGKGAVWGRSMPMDDAHRKRHLVRFSCIDGRNRQHRQHHHKMQNPSYPTSHLFLKNNLTHPDFLGKSIRRAPLRSYKEAAKAPASLAFLAMPI